MIGCFKFKLNRFYIYSRPISTKVVKNKAEAAVTGTLRKNKKIARPILALTPTLNLTSNRNSNPNVYPNPNSKSNPNQ